MTENTLTKNHNTYGGAIYASDFETYDTHGNAIDRIVASMKFDERCRRNAERRDNYKKGNK